jgi:hypothetical protein
MSRINNIFIADTKLNAVNVDASNVLNAGINIALWGIGVLSTAVIVYAAFRIVTARGDTEKVKQGRMAITWGMVGLGIALMTSFIISTVVNLVG